jgi:hypothetical protein
MIKENNKIIAEFLGLKKTNYEVEDLWSTVEYLVDNPESTLACSVPIDTTPPFHISWDCLMAVVDKIESIKDSYHGRFGIYISSNSCTIQSTNFRPDKPIPNPPHYYDNIVLNTKIESVYYSVINFINFYNKQKEE